jgi:regulatory protein
MTIVSLKTEAKGELNRVELSDGSLFSYRINYLPPELLNTNIINPGTAQGMEINAAEEAAFRLASACLRAEKAALRLIARAEQCTPGLARKLKKRGHESVCINAVISRLTELKLLDDRRFAQLWLESRLRLARSPRRLLSSLYSRGIDRDDAESALKAALDEDTEDALLSRFVKKHSRKAGGNDDRAVTRSLKYLLKSEGFSSAAIQKFFDEE